MATEQDEAPKNGRMPTTDHLSRESMVALPETGLTEELKKATSADHRQFEVIYCLQTTRYIFYCAFQ